MAIKNKRKKFHKEKFEKAGWKFIKEEKENWAGKKYYEDHFQSPRMEKPSNLWITLGDSDLTDDYLLDIEFSLFKDALYDKAIREMKNIILENILENYSKLTI